MTINAVDNGSGQIHTVETRVEGIGDDRMSVATLWRHNGKNLGVVIVVDSPEENATAAIYFDDPQSMREVIEVIQKSLDALS